MYDYSKVRVTNTTGLVCSLDSGYYAGCRVQSKLYIFMQLM
jgi:hypothetical protein